MDEEEKIENQIQPASEVNNPFIPSTIPNPIPAVVSEETKIESQKPPYISTPKPSKLGTAIFHIEVGKIKPNPQQPRKDFDPEHLKELAESIREFGVIQPLIVSRVETENEDGTTNVSYELIAGERRLMASKLAGLPVVPVIIRSIDLEREKLELAIIENIQRADLNPIESAKAFARLQDEFKLTQREIAVKLGKSREVVANSLRLLNLPTEIQEAVSSRLLSESQARMLLSVSDIPSQKALFDEILNENLSVREIRSRVRSRLYPEEATIQNPLITPETFVSYDPHTSALKEQLEEFLGTKVDLRKEGDSGKITINFYSEEELSSIIEKLLKQNDSQSL